MSPPTRDPAEDERRELHAIAERAMRDLRANPNNQEAADALSGALDELRSWAAPDGGGGTRNRDADEAAGTKRLGRGGSAMAGLQQLGRGVLGGADDELSGVVRGAAGIMSGQVGPAMTANIRQGIDDSRNFSRVANEDYPIPSGVGQVTGTIAGGMLGGAGALKAAPRMAGAIARGFETGAHIVPRITSAANLAAMGAVEGSVRGFAGADRGDFYDRLNAAGTGAVVGGVVGGAGGVVGQGVKAGHDLIADGLGILRGRRIITEAQVPFAQNVAANRARTLAATTDRQPLITRRAEVGVERDAAIAAKDRLQTQALELSLSPERQAAQNVARMQQAALRARRLAGQPGAAAREAARETRAAEAHAARMNSQPATAETPDAVAITRMRREAMETTSSPETAMRAAIAKKLGVAQNHPSVDRAMAARQGSSPPAVQAEAAPTPPPSGNPAAQPKPPRQVDPTEPTRPSAPGRVYKPRGATKARLAATQSDIARRSLASAPTERMTASVRALFANLPAAEREEAMRAFLGVNAPGRVHPGWVPILNDLRSLP